MDARSTINRRLFRFGLFEADLELGTLSRQGVPVKLQEQPFRILALLLESSGEILSRDELRKNIWPDGTYVDFDGSLNTALMKLRAALNDSADNPRFIETVPRKGYRFIAPVELSRIESPSITTAIRIEADGPALNEVAPQIEARQPQRHVTLNGVYERRLGPHWWEALLILVGVTAFLT
ncbi:MAG: winged helix-turn-helix domain-containing protein, partial [Candidatus Acidiferrales bacterium]